MNRNNIKYPFLDLADVNAPYMERLQEAAARTIASGRYVGGPEVENFEKELAQATGTRHAIGLSNGLDSIRLILKAYMTLGRLRPGDGVIVPSNTFFASVLAVTDCGLTPVFAEPDPLTHNLDTSRLEEVLTPHTRAVLTVHLYGRVAYDRALEDFVARHGLLLIEDNAQAIGAISPVPGPHGSHHTGALGHAAAFSFYPTKNVGALGDAGAVTTDDDALADVIRSLRNYGSDSQYHYPHEGLNCRLDPLQAAMLRIKLPDAYAEGRRRQAVADVYSSEIMNPAVTPALNTGGDECVWHQYVVRAKNRDRFRTYLAENGVETLIHYPIPPHRQPCYDRFSHLKLPVADMLADEVVSLPIAGSMTPEKAREIAAIINKYNPDE